MFGKVTIEHESYWKMIGDPDKIDVLAVGIEEGKAWPLTWTCERGKGRVFASILGHYTWTFDVPLFRIFVLRGVAFTVAPGEAFGPGGQGNVRLCFASGAERLSKGLDRIEDALKAL